MFKQGIVTIRGEELEAKVRAGLTTMMFTKITMGDGVYSGDIRELTALVTEKQSFGISSIALSEENTVRLRTVIDNDGMVTGYYIREIGVYASDPDVGEVLHSVIQGMDDKLDYQPSVDEFNKATMTLDIFVKTVSAETTTIMSGSGATASAEDLAEIKKRLDALASSCGKVFVGSASLPIDNNDTLFVIDEIAPAQFSGAAYSNMVFSEGPPSNAFNWAQTGGSLRAVMNNSDNIIDGKLVVSEEADSDTTFFAQINKSE